MSVAVIMFEGGPEPRDELEQTIGRLRQAVALDTLERAIAVPGVDRVVLATNRGDLRTAAAAMGVTVLATPERLAFGRELMRAVQWSGADAVVYLGGVAVPLLSPAEWEWVVRTVREQAPCVVVNNPQSADMVAWSPARALERLEPVVNDNFLGYLLRHDLGLERHLVPNSAAVHFDLDTPTDYLVLAESGRAGLRAAGALAELDWDRRPVQAIAGLMRRDLAEIGLIGRVGTAVVEYMNMCLRLRLRVFSEERGMKALRRDEQGLAVSFMGDVMTDLGPDRFFALLARSCQGIIFDTRVVFAHGGHRVTDWDRFHSDLGRVELIRDARVRELTAAARAAPVPVLLGGHSVVAGGLWVLAEQIVARMGGRQ